MDIAGIAGAAAAMTQAKVANQVQLTMFRKALDLEAESVRQLVQSVAPAPAVNSSGQGSYIDTWA